VSAGGGSAACLVDAGQVIGRNIVYMSFDSTFWVDSGVIFQSYEKLVVSKVSPSAGSMDGGWLVTLFGSFSDLNAFVCRIGSHTADAQRIWGGLSCHVGALSRSGIFSVELSGNGVHFSAVGSIFVVPSSNMLRLEPSCGSLSGGTNVIISGDESFSRLSSLWCRFCDLAVVNAAMKSIFNNVHVVTCPSPSQLRPTNCSVEISSDRQNWLRAGWFEYRNTIRLDGINPSVGSVLGGTAVSVNANEVRSGDRLICRFGAVQSVAAVSETGRFVCVTPAVNESRFVDVTLSLNDQEWSVGSALFGYLEPIELLWVEPHTIVAGHQQSIRIGALNFWSSLGAIFCRFAGHSSSVGRIVSDNVAECPLDSLSISGNVSVDVSFNAIDWSSTLSLNVLSAHRIQLMSTPFIYYNTPGELDVALPSDYPLYSCLIGGVAMNVVVKNGVLKCRHGPIVSNGEFF